jgi:hypothetical protein
VFEEVIFAYLFEEFPQILWKLSLKVLKIRVPESLNGFPSSLQGIQLAQ